MPRRAGRAVERHGQVRPQRLAQWMLGHERAQLADELGVAAAGELGLDAAFQRVQPHLVEPECLGHQQAALAMSESAGPRQSASASANDSEASCGRPSR